MPRIRILDWLRISCFGLRVFLRHPVQGGETIAFFRQDAIAVIGHQALGISHWTLMPNAYCPMSAEKIFPFLANQFAGSCVYECVAPEQRGPGWKA